MAHDKRMITTMTKEIRDRAILSNSIDRVMRTTIRLLTEHPDFNTNDDIDMNLQDWLALQSVVKELWDKRASELRSQQHKALRDAAVARDGFHSLSTDPATRDPFKDLLQHVAQIGARFHDLVNQCQYPVKMMTEQAIQAAKAGHARPEDYEKIFNAFARCINPTPAKWLEDDGRIQAIIKSKLRRAMHEALLPVSADAVRRDDA